MSKPLLERINPSRPREKTIDWPFELGEGEKPKITLRVLGGDKLEAAYFETVDHFKKIKRPTKTDDPAFVVYERAAIIWRAIVDDAGQPIAESVDKLMAEPAPIREVLYDEFRGLQLDVAPVNYTAQDLHELVNELKKNTRVEALRGCSSSLLIDVITTLVGQLASSTKASESGL